MTRPRSASSQPRRHRAPSRSRWRRIRKASTRGAPPRFWPPPSDEQQPPAHDIEALLATHPSVISGAELRGALDERGIKYGPAFAGLATAHTAQETGSTVLAEIGLPSVIRKQQTSFCVHPALLDACFQSVAAHPSVANAGHGGLLLPLGVRRLQVFGAVHTTPAARYCYARITAAAGTSVEADLDVLDEQGTVLLAVRGLQMGTGFSPSNDRARMMGERLLTVEWQQRELPDVAASETGTWLLISTSDNGLMASPLMTLTDAFKLHDTECTTLSWPLHADHPAIAGRLRDQIAAGSFTGIIVLTDPSDGADDQSPVRGADFVHHVVRITRELPEIMGQTPRLCVVTRNAQTVLSDDRLNLEQGGLRGLLRVIGTEHPHLQTTHIDIDEQTSVEQLARQLLSGSEEDETAWRNDEWYTARLCPTPLRPEERQTTIANQQSDGMRLQIRMPGDLQSMEFAAFDRVPPGPGQIEVAVTASSINFADVLLTFGRYQSFDGQLPQLGTDFAGVVTAVGPDVTNHKVGDHVGGMSRAAAGQHSSPVTPGLAMTLPTGLTDAQAAAVTTAHATAWYGLHDLARIRAGDKVLIHSATGGVGQAAIAIARAAGAEIFATAGSPKRRELLRNMGIEHVYDSRSIEFAEQIRRDTDGYGVDIVLNS